MQQVFNLRGGGGLWGVPSIFFGNINFEIAVAQQVQQGPYMYQHFGEVSGPWRPTGSGAPSRNKFLSRQKNLKSLRKKLLGLHETFVFLKSGSFGLHETIPNLLNHASNPLRDTRGYHVAKAD